MADKELTELDLLTSLASVDLFLVRDISAGKDKKVEVGTLAAFLPPNFIDELDDVDTTTIPPTPGDVLAWNGTNWVPSMSSAPGAHALTHISAGSDEIDGDKLDIDFVPVSYVPVLAPPFSTALGQLTSHLAGIDFALASVTTSFLALTDTPASYAGAALRFVKVNAGATGLEFVAASSAAISLDDLSDVTITAVATGELLVFTGSVWENQTLVEAGVASSSHTHTFLSLTDTPSVYTAAGSKFVKVNSGATGLEFIADPGYLTGSSSLNDLSDVVITTPFAGQYLCFNGTNWVNAYIPINDLSDVDTVTSPPSPGDVLAWNGTNWVPAASSAPGAHASTHISSGTDEIDGDRLDIDFVPANYTRTAVPLITTLVVELTSHLKGIDLVLATFASSSHTHTFLDLTDTPSTYAGAGSRFVKVNSGATLLEFVADPGYLTDINSEFLNDLSDVVITGPTSGQILRYDGANWINSPETADDDSETIPLNDLSDVTITAVATGELLVFTGTVWENQTLTEAGVASSSHTHTFLSLTDTPSTYAGAALRFVKVNAGATALEFVAASSAAIALDDLSDVVLTSPTSGQILRYDGANWINSPETADDDSETIPLNDLSDVTITAVATGELLVFTGTVWENQTLTEAGVASSSHTHTFLSLTDTPASYAAAGSYFVKVNSGASALEFVAASAVGLSLDNLSDVIITSAASGQYLCFNGTNWVNAYIPINDLSDVDTVTTPPISGDFLAWNGTNWVPTPAGTPGAHAASHIRAGSDEIDGDLLDIDFGPTNYTSTIVAPTTSTEHLTSHLKGIDLALASHTHTFLSLTDTPSSYATHALKFVKVNTGATALEFIADPGYLTGSSSLNALSDVVLTSPVSGQYLCFDGVNWVNSVINLNDLGDVVLTAPSSSQYLRFNGTNWVNATITAGDITGLTNTIVLEDEGTTVTGGPHSILNFVGSGVTVTNAGSGEATITISSGGTTPKYDCQEAISTSTASTDSTTYIDLGGMTLTSKNLTETGTYKLTFSCSANCEKPNRTYRFRFVVGGTPTGEEFLNSSGSGGGATDEMNVSFTQVVSGVANGTVVKVQFHVDDPTGANAVNVFGRSLVILGVPGSQVVV